MRVTGWLFLILATLLPVPAAAVKMQALEPWSRIQKPIAFVELARIPVPRDFLADAAMAPDLTQALRDLWALDDSLRAPPTDDPAALAVLQSKREAAAVVAKALLPRWFASARTPWAWVYAADLAWRVAIAQAGADPQSDPDPPAKLDFVLRACQAGRKLAGAAPLATAFLWYLEALARIDTGEPALATAALQQALPLAQGRMQSDVRFRLGGLQLDGHDLQGIATLEAIPDADLQPYARLRILAGLQWPRLAFCPERLEVAVRVLVLATPADLSELPELARETLMQCLADPLEVPADDVLPASLPDRASYIELAQKTRAQPPLTAQQAVSMVVDRCIARAGQPSLPTLAVQGRVAKLTIAPATLPKPLERCIRTRAAALKLPGRVHLVY